MPTKERMQNPTCNDTIRLRLFSYNSNNRADLQSVDRVDIYTIDPNAVTALNPDGRRLVETFQSASIVSEGTGALSLIHI